MFTGLIRQQGVLAARSETTLLIDCPGLLPSLQFGDSVAVNGVCLTVARLSKVGFGADLLPSTLSHTTLGGLPLGSAVNLELPLAAADLLGGHLVHGVVDGTVGLLECQELPGGAVGLRFELPGWLSQWLIPKGAVCLDGVSLTVQELGPDSFSVELVPTTLAETTLGTIQPSSRVNLEADQLIKAVHSVLSSMQATGLIGGAPTADDKSMVQAGASGE